MAISAQENINPKLTIITEYGTIMLTSKQNALLYLDGVAIGNITANKKCILENVEVGQHILKLKYSNDETESKKIEVKKDIVIPVDYLMQNLEDLEIQASGVIYNYIGLGLIRARTTDKEPYSISVDIYLGYESENENVQSYVTSRESQIRDFLRVYFSNKNSIDLRPSNEEQIKNEIMEKINTILPRPVIKEVLFELFDLQPL